MKLSIIKSHFKTVQGHIFISENDSYMNIMNNNKRKQSRGTTRIIYAYGELGLDHVPIFPVFHLVIAV